MTNTKIYNTVNESLKVCESENPKEEYILEGIFAELDVMNVNHRIYTVDEYLRHLQYIREDVKNGRCLGELDHPDVFETKLDNVSHQVIDIWYEPDKKLVMGKIRLLTTPKGKTARALVDDGVPLCISSRAAGTINKDGTVSIQQLYTYDLVAKPGFAKAVLHRVNESEQVTYNDNTMNFLRESESTNYKTLDMLNESFYTDSNPGVLGELRKEAIAINADKNSKINMETLTEHVVMNENAGLEQQPDNSAATAAAMGIPTADTDIVTGGDTDKKTTDISETDKEDDSKEVKTDDTSKEDDKKDDKSSEDDDYEILDVKVYKEDSDDDEKDDSKKEKDDSDDSEKEEDDDTKDDKNKEDDGDSDKDETSEAKQEKEPTEANKLFDKKDELNKKTERFTKQFDELLTRIKTKNKVDESVVKELAESYAFTKSMSESSLLEFSQLSDNKKRKVRDYLCENSVTADADIDKVWRNGLTEGAQPNEPVWLQKAPHEYREMYYGASTQKQIELMECAKYLNFYTQSDIDTFWENSNLRVDTRNRLIQEAYIDSLPKITKKPEDDELPYSMDAVKKMLNLMK